MKKNKKIVLATGGTGGHVFPAESVAQILLDKKQEIILITDKRFNKFSLDFSKMKKYELNVTSLSGNIVQKIKAIIKLEIAIIRSIYILFKEKPDIVIGFGGYPSFPTLIAAYFLGIPIIIHEQNACAGSVNRFFESMAKKVLISFPNVKGFKNKLKQIFIGTPVRNNIIDLANKNYQFDDEVFNIFITGGSLGAKIFSELMPKVISHINAEYRKKINIIQQVHQDDIDEVKEKYDALQVNSEINSFFNDIDKKYAVANLVIARAGASTVAEISIAKKPAILIPLPSAKDNHQFYNAKNFVDHGCGFILNQKEIDIEKFANIITDLVINRDKLKEMSENTAKISKLNSADEMAKIILAM